MQPHQDPQILQSTNKNASPSAPTDRQGSVAFSHYIALPCCPSQQNYTPDTNVVLCMALAPTLKQKTAVLSRRRRFEACLRVKMRGLDNCHQVSKHRTEFNLFWCKSYPLHREQMFPAVIFPIKLDATLRGSITTAPQTKNCMPVMFTVFESTGNVIIYFFFFVTK